MIKLYMKDPRSGRFNVTFLKCWNITEYYRRMFVKSRLFVTIHFIIVVAFPDYTGITTP